MSAADDIKVVPGQLAYRPDQAGAVLGISRSEIYRLINAGQIRTVLHGRCVLIRREELQRWLDQLEDEQIGSAA